MKKLFTIALFSAFLSIQLAGQGGIPGFLEITVEDLPGSATNRAVVKAKAISSLIPALTTCDGDNLADNIIAGFKFAVRWPVSSNITSVSVTASNNPPSACPDIEENTIGGYGLTFGGGVLEDNGWRVRPFLGSWSLPIPTPTTWVLNEWMTICTLTITLSPACTVCDQLDIYMLGDNPNLETDNDLDHVLAFDQAGAGVALEYDLHPNNGPLPLNLIAFEAEKFETQSAALTWTTANEENTSHFQIQRSFDKKTWSEIGSTSAAGYSVAIRNYSFMDHKVYNGRDARLPVYYRLNMVDLDGRQRYSPIESVVFGNSFVASNSFSVYPNPASDGIQVEWDANNIDQPTILELYDVTGKLVLQHRVADNTNQEYIDFGPAKMTAGLYMLRILNGTESLDYKQIVVGQNR